MTHTISCVFAKETPFEKRELTSDLFDEARSIVEDDFNGTLDFIDNDGPAFNVVHGFIPYAHFALELTAEEDDLDAITDQIDPIIANVVKRHTRELTVTD